MRVVRAFVIIRGALFSDKCPFLNHLLAPSTTLLSCSVGGDRNDTLFLGAGDIGAGEEGNDTFAILAAQATNPTQDFALIRDYSSTDDAIAVVVQDGSTPIIIVTADGTDSIISIGETVLAHVTGAGSTLTAADVTIISSPTVGVLDPNT